MTTRYAVLNMINTFNTTLMLYTKVKRINPELLQGIIFSVSFILYLYVMMHVHSTYCDNHFMMYVSQVYIKQ